MVCAYMRSGTIGVLYPCNTMVLLGTLSLRHALGAKPAQLPCSPPSTPTPQARAFHAAAALGRRVYVFGGHVLSYDEGANKKKRVFYNDLWALDTVRCRGTA